MTCFSIGSCVMAKSVLYQKILITGATGLLGQAFLRALKNSPSQLLTPKREDLDFTDSDQVKAYAKKNEFDLIIHCGAYTNVDMAESKKDLCNRVNKGGVANLVALDKPLISFSTDYVFDGEQMSYQEDAPRRPLNIYGKSKAMAEEVLESHKSSWWNIRTSWLYGPGGRNFVDTVVKKIKNEDPIHVVDDQNGRLTNVDDLASFVASHFIEAQPTSGHYHVQGTGDSASWYDVVECIKSLLGSKHPVNSISSFDLNLPALRPEHSILENTKLCHHLPDWKESLHDYVKVRHQ